MISFLMLFIYTISGEPLSVHILLYSFADFFGRTFRMINFKIGSHTSLLISTTRLSIKNWFKYFFSAFFDGAFGVPRFVRITPILPSYSSLYSFMAIYQMSYGYHQ